MSAPSKTAARSASTAAGPVTWLVMPSGASSSSRWRSSVTLSAFCGGRGRLDRDDRDRRRTVLGHHHRTLGPGGYGAELLSLLAERADSVLAELALVARPEHDGGGRTLVGKGVAQLGALRAVEAGGQRVQAGAVAFALAQSRRSGRRPAAGEAARPAMRPAAGGVSRPRHGIRGRQCVRGWGLPSGAPRSTVA